MAGEVLGMTWEVSWGDPFAAYLRHFEGLIGDRCTGVTFGAVVKGIIGAGSLVCERIAAHSEILTATTKGAQRVIRLAKGESTKRSQLDAASLTEKLRRRGLAQLAESGTDELWLMFDGSDLRKPHAEVMPALMQVKDLDGSWVPGYRTLNVLGVTPKRRGILYHRLFSSHERDFISEPAEVQQVLVTVHQAIHGVADHHNALERCKKCFGQGQWCAHHNIAQDDPKHKYTYPAWDSHMISCPKCKGVGYNVYIRHTCRHALGRALHPANSGALQWGPKYRELHDAVWAECRRVLKPSGILVLNRKDHYRKGVIQLVTNWHAVTLLMLGFTCTARVHVPCPGQRHGANRHLRVAYESVLQFRRD